MLAALLAACSNTASKDGSTGHGSTESSSIEPGTDPTTLPVSLAFAGGFVPRNAPHGGFGGGACAPSGRTPVVLIHGNGDHSANWTVRASDGGPSVIQQFKAAGYTDCDLFAITFLSEKEREHPLDVFHTTERQRLISDFVDDVLTYTKARRVDVISHSLGVTMSQQAFTSAESWPKIRRFVAIAGAMRGIQVCLLAGPYNQSMMTCASQNPLVDNRFGFFPKEYANPKMGTGAHSFANLPKLHPMTRFYSIRAGLNDEIVCAAPAIAKDKCALSSQYEPAGNVRSQLDVGFGSTAPADFDPNRKTLESGGDLDGIGHMRAKTDTGLLQVNMLTRECSAKGCCTGYSKKCER